MAAPFSTELIIIGGGPAGCAAAVMAASVKMRSVIVEQHSLCHTLRYIPALDNVLGFTSGPNLATAITADVHRSGLSEVLLADPAEHLDADGDSVTLRLASGHRITAPFAVVATGVRPAHITEAPWITGAHTDLSIPQLRDAEPEVLADKTLLVLGADRPLGTLLRSHPDLASRLVVIHPAADDYKADEVREDPRVDLTCVEEVSLQRQPDGTFEAKGITKTGQSESWTADAAFLNLGCLPVGLSGALQMGPSGYCPPEKQLRRLLVAGDLRSPRGQRIMTSIGSGSEAALHAYYSSRLNRC